MITNKEKNFVSAVVYCHNCQGAIASFLDGVNTVLKDNFDKYEKQIREFVDSRRAK